MSEHVPAIGVGLPYTLFNGEHLWMQSACVMECIDEGYGYFLNIYMPHITTDEVKGYKNNKLLFRVIEHDGMILAMCRFGHTPLMYELEFDPTIYKDRRGFQLIDTNNTFTIVVVDSSNNLVGYLRSGNIPVRLREKWILSWTQAEQIPNFSKKYKDWVNTLRSKYEIHELWDIASPVGYLGDK